MQATYFLWCSNGDYVPSLEEKLTVLELWKKDIIVSNLESS